MPGLRLRILLKSDFARLRVKGRTPVPGELDRDGLERRRR
jgi:hypothetical protein